MKNGYVVRWNSITTKIECLQGNENNKSNSNELYSMMTNDRDGSTTLFCREFVISDIWIIEIIIIINNLILLLGEIIYKKNKQTKNWNILC